MEIKQFRADASLLYAIQRSTKQSSVDILTYFYSIIRELESSLKGSTARVPNRKLKSLYPETGIPYQLEVQCDYNNKNNVYVYLTFPKNQAYIDDIETTMKEVAERSLLGQPMPAVANFDPPAYRAPRGKRHLIND